MTTLQEKLDRFQRDAATAPGGPCLIFGAPGAGKTLTVMARAAMLIRRGVAPESVVLLTCSRRGIQDIHRRLADLAEECDGLQRMFVGTPAQYANEVLRTGGAAALGLPDCYSIWDSRSAADAFRNVVLDTIGVPALSTGEAEEILAWDIGNRNRRPGDPVLRPRLYSWHRVITNHDREKRDQHALSLDDLVPTAVRALDQGTGLRPDWMSGPSVHLLVDDGHHLTPAQYHFLSLVTGDLTIAADPNGNRFPGMGADGLLSELRRDWGGVAVHQLLINHLHTIELSTLAGALTEHGGLSGLQQFRQIAFRRGGMAPQLVEVHGHDSMLHTLLEGVEQMRAEGYHLEDMAVICRDLAESERLRTDLEARHIPCTVLGDPQVHHRDSRVLALLACMLNPRNVMAFWLTPFGNSQTREASAMRVVSQVLSRMAREQEMSVFEAAQQQLNEYEPGSSLHRALAAMVDAKRLLDPMLDDPVISLPDLLRRAQELLPEHMGDGPLPGEESRMSRLIVLSEAMHRRAGEGLRQHLVRFLDRANPDLYPDSPVPAPGLTLTTVNGSEGKYWKVVWVWDDPLPGDTTPYGQGSAQDADRLFFLAVTRATDRLHCFCPADDGVIPDPRTRRFAQALRSALDQ